jgi:two-component system sensor histidine kinase LytS
MRAFPVSIIVPLTVSERTVGTLKLYYRNASDVNRTQLAIARGLAELLSSQLSVYELDRQAELTARAEVKALQAQINPHFLFNTLNTIASFTRTDPTRARDLLREFSVFYRRTLEGTEAPILLSDELEQTRRYLTIEQARFGDDRIVLTEGVELGCGSIRVPAFIVQPIVENAVRHAMRDEGTLHIDVQVATDGQDVLIAVADDGLGMSEEVAERLVSDKTAQGSSTSSKGTGIALRNVADRIELFYGEGSGIEIMSKVDSGTCVTLRLVGATRACIRRPFIGSAVVQGLVSGVITCGVLAGALYLAGRSFPQILAVFTPEILAAVAGIVLASGVLICVLATYFTVNKLALASEDSLYY